MSDLTDELDWYYVEIEKERKRCDLLWSDYSNCRATLDRLEQGRAKIFRALMKDAETRGNARSIGT